MRQINPHIFLEECVNNIRSEYMALLELHPDCKVVIRPSPTLCETMLSRKYK